MLKNSHVLKNSQKKLLFLSRIELDVKRRDAHYSLLHLSKSGRSINTILVICDQNDSGNRNESSSRRRADSKRARAGSGGAGGGCAGSGGRAPANQ